MSEAWEAQSPTEGAAGEDAGSEPTAGALLRRAREAAGLHVAALAVALKVPVRKLEALESDRHDLLTDAVFVRALASSVCRTLKIDPQPVLQRLPQMTAPRLTSARQSINAPFRAPSDGAPPTWLDQLSRPVFLAVFALLLGALVLILLPKAQTPDVAAPQANSVVTHVPSAAPAPSSVPAAEAVSAAVSPLVSAAAASASAPAAAAASAASPATAAASAAKAPASSAAAAPAAPAMAKAVVAEAPAAPASGLIVFRAKGSSWVEVTDAKGVVAVRKVLEAGESAAASGALPLKVTIGRVDATEVRVRGKPFDLRTVTSDNVARFQVK